MEIKYIIPKLSPALLMIVLLASCSSSTIKDLPTATLQQPKTINAADYQYLVGTDDTLSIFVWRNPDISGSFIVRPDGKITTSLAEDLVVAGKTPTEIARMMEEVLSKYLRDPIVTVTVSNFVGPYSEQIRIIGEATNPRAINYRQNMTLLDVMIAVGGLTPFADGNDASVIRIIDGKQQQYYLHLDDLIRDGDLTANVDILPGDIIIIPETWF